MNQVCVSRTGLMRMKGGKQNIRRKNCASAILSTTNPTRIVKKSSQDSWDERQATNDLNNGTPHQ
jgi:hypothetical protein